MWWQAGNDGPVQGKGYREVFQRVLVAQPVEKDSVSYIRELQHWAVETPIKVKMLVENADGKENENGELETAGEEMTVPIGDKIHRASVAARSSSLCHQG